ncbi:carcinoembryonic antigen-related cell adhesion molecule 1 [Chanos chanos]|uniref:Carcinoembryonic antigen-related cell adhesion molecule 1 n=1 Tax=Chanos chanos TaxID=29144 RepID=A0A6J2WC81_CHACN|nr:carcinoembryonic antigen-related cell adhesion molecule 5-like [Chanos chanos]
MVDASGATLIASENPLAVGKNVTLSLVPEMSLEEGDVLFETTTIVFWYPGRVRILNFDKDRLSYNSTTSQLHIRSVTLNDSGLYTLQGIVPSLHTHLRLSVQEPISNVSVMVSGTHLVEFTDSVIFRCSALGTPQRYTWFNASSEVTAKNGVQLTENNSVLTISMVTRFDHGPFMCRVSNDINAQNSTLIFFNISYGPSDLKMTVEPQWPLHISGTNITLSCSAQSVPPAMYYWTLNGTKINQHGPVLHLTESRQNQSGEYSCVAQNNITLRNETQTHTITVIDPVCVHDLGAMDGVPVKNMNFSLMCHVTGPVDSIQWMKNGTDLYPDDRISLSNHNRTLTFRPVTRSDEGVFRCVAINAVSNSSSPDYTLTVNYGPSDLKMTVEPQWPLHISGTNITLSCSAQSVPPAMYYWTLNGTKINQHGPVLHLTESRQNQSGDYSCVAQNNITLRNETQTHTITVIDPVCVHDLGAMDGVPVKNMNFSLMCHVTGPVDSIQWMKNGTDLYPDDRISLSNHNRTLTFRPVTRSDEGVFRCVAINAVSNSSSPDYTLTVNCE